MQQPLSLEAAAPYPYLISKKAHDSMSLDLLRYWGQGTYLANSQSVSAVNHDISHVVIASNNFLRPKNREHLNKHLCDKNYLKQEKLNLTCILSILFGPWTIH